MIKKARNIIYERLQRIQPPSGGRIPQSSTKNSDELTSLKTAQEALQRAKERTAKEERYAGENANRISAREAICREAEQDFRANSRRIWKDYQNRVNELTNELRAAVEDDETIRTGDIDEPTVMALESGVCRVADLEAFAKRFEGNRSMLRLIGGHAAKLEDDAMKRGNATETARLHELSALAADGIQPVMDAWQQLTGVAWTCSGYSHDNSVGTDPDPRYVGMMNAQFDELTGEAIAEF